MSKVTMTMHELLATIKRYDDRITAAIDKSFVAICRNDTPISNEEMYKNIDILKGNYDSATHLIDNYYALEAARIASNASTTVEIGGVKYTVADAIKRKHLIKNEKLLLVHMKKSLRDAVATVSRINEEAARRADDVYSATLGQSQSPSTDALELAAKAKQNFIDTHSAELVDPNSLLEKIDALEKSIDTFETEVDAALSVSNALTTVEVELHD